MLAGTAVGLRGLRGTGGAGDLLRRLGGGRRGLSVRHQGDVGGKLGIDGLLGESVEALGFGDDLVEVGHFGGDGDAGLLAAELAAGYRQLLRELGLNGDGHGNGSAG